MGFREDFEKFRKPQEEQKASTVLLPSFNDVRTALREVKSKPIPTATPVQKLEEQNLLKVQEERNKATTLSAPTGKETPLLPSFDFLKDKSTEKQGFKLSDFIIPEVRQGFSQSFGKAEQGTASDIYTEMIPSFGKKRAYEIADGYQKGVDVFGYPAGITLTDSEKQQFDGWKQKHWAMLTLDATDFLGVGIALKSGAGFLSRTGLRNAVSAATKQDNIKAIHAEILKQLPDLKGTKELEDVTEIVIAGREQNPDKLAQIVQRRVSDTTRTPQTSFATPAQKVVYENGIPILRTTTPDTLLERRKEALEALKGNREALRLSNADVLSEEIRAGVLSTKTTADDTVEVFRISPRGRRIRGGEEVSLSEDFARSVSEGVKPQKIEVPIADLIRLPDGTFTFAPERLIKESPELKFPTNIPKPIVEAAKKKEADVIAEKLAKEKAEQKAKREATAKAERELMRLAEEEKQAERILVEQPIKTKQLIEGVELVEKAKISETRIKAKEIDKIIKETQKTIDKLNSEIGNTPKLIAKERNKARKEIKKINNLKRVSVKEKAKRRARVIKERETEIARFQKEKIKLQAQLPKVRSTLIENKGKTIDVDAVSRKIKQETKIQISALKSESETLIQRAKARLETSVKPITKTKKQKAKIKNTEQATTLADSIKESFLITSKTIPDTVTSAISPVKGEGKTVESQIIKGMTDEFEIIKKNFEERGLSLLNLPDTHKAIGNPALMKQAFADLVADPAKVYNDLISGVLPEGTTRAAYALALMKSDFVLSNPTRMSMVARSFLKGNTRIAQEFQSIKVFGRMDYINIIGRFANQADELLKARGVNVEAEAKKLLKRFDNDFDELKTVSKTEITKTLDSITCNI